jgi:hypothetical protein
MEVKCSLDIGSKGNVERCVMIRIGFDPMLEAELHNRELIRSVELYRLAQEGVSPDQPRGGSGLRLLAFIGQHMSSLGATLEARYGEKPEQENNLSSQENPGGCSS